MDNKFLEKEFPMFEDSKKIADGLSSLLADTYTLYVKTQNFHWHVTGENFYSLHKMFEEQYQELALAVDEIAERIRALGYHAPASFSQFLKLTSLKEELGTPSAEEMVKQLAGDHKTLSKNATKALPAAQKAEDEATVDLLISRVKEHEKISWMLNSSL